MKKQNRSLATFLILNFIALSSYSQIVYVSNNSSKNFQGNYPYYVKSWDTNSYDIRNIRKHKIKEEDLTVITYKRHGKRVIENSRVIRTFNNRSYLIEYISFNKGKESSHNIYEYDSNNNKTDYKRWYKGKHYSHSINKFNQYNQLTQRDSYWNNKFQSRAIAIYQDSIITAQWTYRKDSNQVRNKWEYSYYPNWDKKTTRYYKKGQLKHSWNYTCNEEGEEEKPKKETKVCELKQYNADSSYVIIRRLTDENGKISKRKITFDKNNHPILREYFNIQNRLTYKDSSIYLNDKRSENYQFNNLIIQKSTIYTFDTDGKKTSLKELFYKKSGSIGWAHEYMFNKAGKTLESIVYGKNKQVIITRNHKYNEDNKETLEESYNGNGSLISRTIKTYNEKGLLVRSDKYNKDNTLISSVITKYQLFE